MTFALSKILWFVVAPGNLLLLLLGAGLLRLVASGRRKGLGLVGAAFLGFVVIAVAPIGEEMRALLENRFPPPAALPDRIDGIVLLGGAVNPTLTRSRGQVALNDAAERMTETMVLARRFPGVPIVVSGGEALIQPLGFTEAATMRQFLVGQGLEVERIKLEDRSRNTYENAVESRALVNPKPGDVWLLVTSAEHMPRSVGCFRQAGFPIIPYPVDYRTTLERPIEISFSLAEQLVLLNASVKEWVGLLAYWLMGRTDALFPGP